PALHAAAVGDFAGGAGLDAVMVGLGANPTDYRAVVLTALHIDGPTQVIDLPALPTDVAAHDTDGDGDDDLVITLDRDGVADALATLVNDGGFSAERIGFNLVGAAPVSLVLADLHTTVEQRGEADGGAFPEAVVLNAGPQFAGVAGVTISVGVGPLAGASCPADTNGDNQVNFADLNAVLSMFGQSGANLPADVNGDGAVNFADLNAVLSAFGSSCG